MLPNKKIAIIPDTNIYTRSKNNPYDLTDLPLKKYFKQLKTIKDLNLEDKVEILIPEVVLLELLYQNKRNFDDNINNLNNLNKYFINFDINITSPEDLSYDEYFEKLKEKYNYDLKIIHIPPKNELFDDILHRYYNKKPPFENNKDQGFKDTIIFLSILHFAKQDLYSEYILFSDDNIFKNQNKTKLEKEFKYISPFMKSKFEIRNEKNISSYIDKKFKLFNELKEHISSEFYETIIRQYKNAEKIIIDGTEYQIKSVDIIEEKTIINIENENEFEVEISISAKLLNDTEKENTLHLTNQYTFNKEKNEWKYKLN